MYISIEIHVKWEENPLNFVPSRWGGHRPLIVSNYLKVLLWVFFNAYVLIVKLFIYKDTDHMSVPQKIEIYQIISSFILLKMHTWFVEAYVYIYHMLTWIHFEQAHIMNVDAPKAEISAKNVLLFEHITLRLICTCLEGLSLKYSEWYGARGLVIFFFQYKDSLA